METNMTEAVAISIEAAKANIPVLLLGTYGIGKSAVPHEVGAALGLPVHEERPSLREPTDYTGIMHVKDGRTHWAPPAILPTERPVLAFYDEITNARIETQHALYEQILDRRAAGVPFHPDCRVIAAGNLTSDASGAGRLPMALADRFLIIQVVPDAEAWQKWAARAGINPAVRAFISLRPELLHTHKADAESKNKSMVKATPRSWHNVSRIMETSNPEMLWPLAARVVGEGPAGDFMGFLELMKKAPRIPDILANPEGAPIPAEVSIRYAVAAGLANAADANNFAAVLKYAGRLDPEYAVMTALDATTRLPALKRTAAYVQYAVKYQNLTM
jgi:hypothetical protein